jgi:2-dehydropantoate 2-reductase
MKIVIYGAGRIGTMFGFLLARAGHDITFIARGKRLEELQKNPVVETVDGEKATTKSAGELDATTPWDLVLVTVLAHQVDATLPALKASAAKKVMFMFNTVESLTKLRESVGASRFEMAFPTVISDFVNGKLKGTVSGPGNVTTLSSAEWAKIFSDAKIPTEVHSDMESFLRSHAVFVIPLMALGNVAFTTGKGVTWSTARRYARMFDEGFAIVRKLGNALTPSFVSILSKLPLFIRTAMLWGASRSQMLRDLGAMGPGEVRELIDGFEKLSPGTAPEMKALRP